MRRLNVNKFSDIYKVRVMHEKDVPMINDMTRKNVQFYKFCGRENVEADILNDLTICPPGKNLCDKYYVGFFDGEILLAVLDLIDGYPNEKTAYIGFFMMNIEYQGKEIGTKIVSSLLGYLKDVGFECMRLGYDKENPQSKHFWKKNQFLDVKEVAQDGGIIVVAERSLIGKLTV